MARDKLKEVRRRVYQVLEQGPVGDGVSVIVDRALVTLILINLVAVVLESVPVDRRRVTDRSSSSSNIFSLVVFSAEYFLRIWCAVEHGPQLGSHAAHGRGSNMC